MWAVGRFDLGLSEDDFWDLTLLEFDYLCKRKQLNDTRIERYSAQISWLIYSVNRSKDSKALKIDDFMIKYEKEKPKNQTFQQMKSIAKQITKALGGEIK
ncbi:MAG: DUF4035 domain-containing protein [Endomicrobiales bacterium]|nr:DUF4035 domain-containing protein [Endomicrobiales bacterium]